MTSTKDYCKNTFFFFFAFVNFLIFLTSRKFANVRNEWNPINLKVEFYNFFYLKHFKSKILKNIQIKIKTCSFYRHEFAFYDTFLKNKFRKLWQISKKFMWIALVFKWRINPCFFCSCYFHHDVVFLLYIFGWGVGDSINRRKIYTTIFFFHFFLSSFFNFSCIFLVNFGQRKLYGLSENDA